VKAEAPEKADHPAPGDPEDHLRDQLQQEAALSDVRDARDPGPGVPPAEAPRAAAAATALQAAADRPDPVPAPEVLPRAQEPGPGAAAAPDRQQVVLDTGLAGLPLPIRALHPKHAARANPEAQQAQALLDREGDPGRLHQLAAVVREQEEVPREVEQAGRKDQHGAKVRPVEREELPEASVDQARNPGREAAEYDGDGADQPDRLPRRLRGDPLPGDQVPKEEEEEEAAEDIPPLLQEQNLLDGG
jgi:hypothetical protein